MQVIRIYKKGMGLVASFKGLNAEKRAKENYPENDIYLWLR